MRKNHTKSGYSDAVYSGVSTSHRLLPESKALLASKRVPLKTKKTRPKHKNKK